MAQKKHARFLSLKLLKVTILEYFSQNLCQFSRPLCCNRRFLIASLVLCDKNDYSNEEQGNGIRFKVAPFPFYTGV